MQMLIDARTDISEFCPISAMHWGVVLFIGANQRIILCNDFVVREHIVPNRQSTRIARSTVCTGVLHSSLAHVVASLGRLVLRCKRIHTILKSRIHNSSCKDHLGDSVGQTRDSSCLTKKVTPSYNPSPDSNALLRNNMLRYKIHPSRRRIRGYQLGD